VALRRTLTTSGLSVLSRRPVLEQRVLALPQDVRDGERLAQCVRLPGETGDWWLVNLHLTSLPDRADLRRAQLDAVLAAVDTFDGGLPVVLCGDFNAAPGDPEIADWLQPRGPLTDVFAGQPKVTHIAEDGRAQDLDQVLLHSAAGRPPVAGVPVGVVLDRPDAHGVVPSDHFAVCADLSL
jgi:endonuclease/exonuclease/phosphatase family metal-dependent hydrolase